MATPGPATNKLFGAIKTQLEAASYTQFLTGGLVKEEQSERQQVPYGVLLPINESVQTRTNTTEYRRVAFSLAVIGATFEAAGELLGQLDALLDSERLALDGAQLVKFWHSDVNYPPRESQKEKATQAYEAIVGMTRNRKPIPTGE